MTEPVIEISGLMGTDRNTTRGGMLKRKYEKGHLLEAEDDNVDISEEARSRSTEKKREDILGD